MFDVRGKKVCVAGASGFLGGWICRELVQAGAYVTGVSSTGRVPDGLNIPMVSADLRNYKAAETALEGQQALVISAAVTSGAQIMATSPLTHLLDNVILNGSVLRAATHHQLEKCVFISSSTVYPEGDKAMSEEDYSGQFFAKYEVVASMKKSMEDDCRLISKYSDTAVVIARPGNAYGPWDHFDSESSHVIPALVSKVAKASKVLHVWGDGKDIKNFIYVKDLAKGIVQALAYGDPGETYNLGGATEITVKEVINILLGCAGKSQLRVEYDSSKPSMIPVRRINSGKAAGKLGFHPTTSPEVGLRETYEWYVKAKL